jgi:hypothetical protein
VEAVRARPAAAAPAKCRRTRLSIAYASRPPCETKRSQAPTEHDVLRYVAHEVACIVAVGGPAWPELVHTAVAAFELYDDYDEPEDAPDADDLQDALESAKRYALIVEEVAVRAHACVRSSTHVRKASSLPAAGVLLRRGRSPLRGSPS